MNTITRNPRAADPAHSREHIALPTPHERARLSRVDKLSVHIGIWLLLRQERARTQNSERHRVPHNPYRAERAATQYLVFNLHRGAR